MTSSTGVYRGLKSWKCRKHSRSTPKTANGSPSSGAWSELSSILRAPYKSQLDLSEVPIKVTVGTSEPVIFYVQVAALKAHSDFFAAALNKGWKEAEEKVVKLPDERPQIFAVFANFALSGKIMSAAPHTATDLVHSGGNTAEEADREEALRELERERSHQEVLQLCRCWVFGERSLSANFKDAATDALIELMTEDRRGPNDWIMQNIFEQFPGRNGLKRLFVDIAAWAWSVEDYEDTEDEITSPAFWRELARSLRAQDEWETDGDWPFLRRSCQYHDHDAENKTCYKAAMSSKLVVKAEGGVKPGDAKKWET